MWKIMKSIDGIKAWKSHVLHTVYLDEAQRIEMEAMPDHTCYMVLDWGMKVLPMRHRETQQVGLVMFNLCGVGSPTLFRSGLLTGECPHITLRYTQGFLEQQITINEYMSMLVIR